MLKFANRHNMVTAWLVALVVCVAFASSEAAFPDHDSDQQSSGFGQTDDSDDSGTHYHFHYHYHSPYLSHDDDSGAAGYGGAQKFAPNGVAGANRYYTPGYLKSSRTPSPSQSFIGDRDDEDGRTEIMDQPGADDADDNDEVGENVDQPGTDGDDAINTYLSAASQTRQTVSRPATNSMSRPAPSTMSRPAPGARPLPGDRAYLRVIMPMPNAKLIYDGHEVPGQGLLRSVMTPPLAEGGRSTYTLVACWKDQSGNPRVSVHEAAIEAGEHQTVEFNVAPVERP